MFDGVGELDDDGDPELEGVSVGVADGEDPTLMVAVGVPEGVGVGSGVCDEDGVACAVTDGVGELLALASIVPEEVGDGGALGAVLVDGEGRDDGVAEKLPHVRFLNAVTDTTTLPLFDEPSEMNLRNIVFDDEEPLIGSLGVFAREVKSLDVLTGPSRTSK